MMNALRRLKAFISVTWSTWRLWRKNKKHLRMVADLQASHYTHAGMDAEKAEVDLIRPLTELTESRNPFVAYAARVKLAELTRS